MRKVALGAVAIMAAGLIAVGGYSTLHHTHRSLVAAKRSTSTTTTAPPITYVTIPAANLASIYSNAGMQLMGQAPSGADIQAFVSSYQQDEIICERLRKTTSCPTLASPEIDAQETIQKDYSQAVAAYEQRQRAIAGYEQYLGQQCSISTTTDPEYPPDQGPNALNANGECPLGSPANP